MHYFRVFKPLTGRILESWWSYGGSGKSSGAETCQFNCQPTSRAKKDINGSRVVWVAWIICWNCDSSTFLSGMTKFVKLQGGVAVVAPCMQKMCHLNQNGAAWESTSSVCISQLMVIQFENWSWISRHNVGSAGIFRPIMFIQLKRSDEKIQYLLSSRLFMSN